ncbi:PREDICTED: probable inactive leucine-rich repeat receptor-like protein kinase At3g03770 [Fragaria vesca subsp. vesca]|uniref:probable inactive leucine-rich repeat receptor-like protein kinase At3g03770 n=1 Tax=Fragaria vesca subsp. vesca TaxID=101020 RepID=UPI0002C300FB|nr:PREDICTED: probable inactive leucine-rich repeat receptor-like protein kinase At3g03770 [Fragaria vesca subsp. vesca]
MARVSPRLMHLVLIIILFSVSHAKSNLSSQALTLLRIQRLLNLPAVLSRSNNYTNLCDIEPSLSLTIICYEEKITQLHIIGEKSAHLPRNFSMDLFVTTLVRLPSLKVLTLVSLGLWGPLPGKISELSSLEILNVTSNFLYGVIPQELSSLSSLQTLILDDNMFSGPLQDWMSSFPLLAVFSAKKNLLNASLPNSLSRLENLRVLGLSHNHFFGEVPDLSALTNLQVLELADNAFGPQFPKLGKKLVTLVLSKNKFRSGIPAEASSYYQLERLDLSFNMFVGPFPPSLLSLPSITYLNVSRNKFTGMLSENLSCNAELHSVDLSSNLLSGSLPTCLLSDSKDSVMLYDRNCLSIGNQNQHPLPFCRNEALAVGIIPDRSKQQRASKSVRASVITAGIFGGVVLIGLIFLVYRRMNTKKTMKKSPTRSITENASAGYTSKLLSDARYISQTMKLGALGLPSYRTFSLDELEEATNNFDTSTFMGEGSHGQMYRGQLKDGSFVAIRCLKLKTSHSSQHFMHHIEHILKLRHRNLVSALGHCLECYLDDYSVSRIFLVFEYVPNGTLRSWISEGHHRRSLTWTQRISAAIGIANGIQFLQTGIIPGVYSNKLKITDILLDQNLVAKISSYNLPLLEVNIEQVGQGVSSGGSTSSHVVARMKHDDATVVHDFGVILLEMIKGRPVKCTTQVGVLKDQLQVVIAADDAARRSMVDPGVKQTCLDQSLKTMMEICVRCLHNEPADRPSFDDVLWNLQYAAQVQDAWQQGECLSSDGSPVSPSQSPRLTF